MVSKVDHKTVNNMPKVVMQQCRLASGVEPATTMLSIRLPLPAWSHDAIHAFRSFNMLNMAANVICFSLWKQIIYIAATSKQNSR